MDANLKSILGRMSQEARHLGLSDRDWATSAHLRPETLARLKGRQDCDLATLTALAAAVDLRVVLLRRLPREWPAQFGRAEEEALLDLCASGSLDLQPWLAAGPRYFTAGVAVMVAGMREADRPAWLALGEALYPGMSSLEEFGGWMAASPLRPSRFIPMLRQRLQSRFAAAVP
jgi:hypothetical protein